VIFTTQKISSPSKVINPIDQPHPSRKSFHNVDILFVNYSLFATFTPGSLGASKESLVWFNVGKAARKGDEEDQQYLGGLD
jgi:hypothetical protein